MKISARHLAAKRLIGSTALAGVLLAGAVGGSGAALAKHGADDLVPEPVHVEGVDDFVLAQHGADDIIPEAPHLEGADDFI